MGNIRQGGLKLKALAGNLASPRQDAVRALKISPGFADGSETTMSAAEILQVQ